MHNVDYTYAVQEDTLRPEINAWGTSGAIDVGSVFTVWANVTDDLSGVQNSTLVISEDSLPYSRLLMPYNGSFYTVSTGDLAVNHTYYLEIEAFDNADNRATSYRITIDLHRDATVPVDPLSTFPVVVGSSFAFLFVAIVVARFYHLKHPHENTSSSAMIASVD